MFARHEPAVVESPLQIIFPANWLRSLKHLLKALKNPEFRTVDALLAAAADDDPAGGVMLKRILYWHGRLGREFYLSKKDWWQQCRVRRKTIDRVKADIFPLCGVVFRVKFTGNANTTHYRLHEWKFLRRLAHVMGLSALYLALKLCTKRTERSVQSEPNVRSERGATLTRDSTSKTPEKQNVNDDVVSSKIVEFKDTPVIELLKSAGVRGQQVLTYATLPEDIVRACIASANEPGVKNRVGYLIGALKKQLQAHQIQPSSGAAVTETPPPNPLPIADELVSESARAAQQKWADVLARLHEPEQPKEPEPVNERLLVVVGSSEYWTAQQAWNSACHQLELQLDRATFDTWLRSAKLVDYEPDTSTFVVKVHNTHARDMLQHRLYRNVARILRDVVGREVTVRFEANEVNATAGQGIGRFLPNNGS